MELKLDFKMLGVGQLTKVVEKLTETQEKFDKIKKGMDTNKKAFSAFADFKFVRFFDALNAKMFDIVRTQKMLKASGGVMGLMSAKFAEFNGMLGSFGAKTLVAKIKLVASAFSAWLVPIALIAAGIYLISRIWKENIGGIQTKWIAFMGRLKNTWSKFDIGIRKFLHEIGPMFDAVFSIGFALLEGIFEGLVATVQVFIGIFGPFLRMAAQLFGMFKTDGQESLKIWKAIGMAIGIVATGLAAFAIIQKIIMMVKMLNAAFIIFNAIVTANPIGAIIVAIVAIIALVIYLQKRFNIFGKAVEIIKKVFLFLWNIIKKIFSFAVQTSPLFQGIKLVMKALKWFKKKKAENDEEHKASERAANTVSQTSQTNNNTTDNRSANVTIHTQQMDSRQANDIGNNFINPVLDVNKSI